MYWLACEVNGWFLFYGLFFDLDDYRKEEGFYIRIVILIIMVLKFHDRDDELSYLSERYRSDQFEFFFIYGRRRVGKTELIKRFIQNKTLTI